jgi:hypothetical protein
MGLSRKNPPGDVAAVTAGRAEIRTAAAAEAVQMADDAFSTIERAKQSSGPAAAIEELIRSLENRGEWHRLFDALLLKKKFEMGLPLSRPTSFDNVPEERQAEFEQAYIIAARRAGESFLAENNIPQAWIYLRTIREPQKVAKALDRIPIGDGLPENVDDLISVALYERAHPVKGLELMLQSRGTCNTITAFDQAIAQISPEERVRGAELLVRHLYGELFQSVCRDIERRGEAPFSGKTLREAITGRDWLFDEGDYHIDVSHLGSVVRFARFLNPDSPELDTVLQLTEYGARLSPQFQFPGDPPFDAYYTAHMHFFRILAGSHRDEAIAYFHDRIRSAEDFEDRRLIAYVLVDLLVRIGAKNDAVSVAKEFLADLDESSGFSFAQLCEEAERMDVYQETAQGKGDLVGFTAALLRGPTANPG